MKAALAASMLLVSSVSGAGAPAPKALQCKGQKPKKDKKTQELRKAVEDGVFFQFAVKQLGAPKSCSVQWLRVAGDDTSTLVYELEKGSAKFEYPAQMSIITFEAPAGFPDEAAVRSFFKDTDDVKQFEIDWKAKPEVSTDNGEKTETWKAPEEDRDAAVALTSKDGKLVRASFHVTL
jgi:hypothetical protein